MTTDTRSLGMSTAVQDLRAAVAAETHATLVLKLTLVLVLLHGATTGASRVPVIVLCGLLLLFPALLRQAFFWWPMLAGLAAANMQAWFTIDNHKYLIMYWTLACALSLFASNQSQYLITTARVCIALVFGFATLWKLWAAEYLDGSFFYHTFLSDPRVTRVSAWLSGTAIEDIALGRDAIAAAASTGLSGVPIPLVDSARLYVATLVLSWTGVIVEGTVAITHLSASPRLYRFRHMSLMAFIGLTYFLLPVSGFAFVLTVMGVAQCREDDVVLRWRYLLLLAIVQLIVLDWQSLLPDAAPAA